MNKQEPVNCSDSELCTYLQALAEGYWPTFYSDTSQSAQSRSMSIASKSYQRGKKTVVFHGFQSLMMCKHSTDGHGADSLTLLPVDSRARTSVLRGKAQDLTANAAGYGASSPASLARYDPDTHSLKTAQLSLIEDSKGCSLILPRSGWMRNGECYQQPMLVRRTYESAFGLWRTPTVGMLNADRAKDPEYTSRKELKGQTITLADQVKHERLWPTPTVCGNYNRKGASETSGDGLATAVLKVAAPTARDWRSGKASQKTMERNSRPLSEQIGGSLNPNWVEWLMGWPIGWTDLNPLETGKSHCAQQQRGACLQVEEEKT